MVFLLCERVKDPYKVIFVPPLPAAAALAPPQPILHHHDDPRFRHVRPNQSLFGSTTTKVIMTCCAVPEDA